MEGQEQAGVKRQREDYDSSQTHKRVPVQGESGISGLDMEEFKRSKKIEAGIESVRKIPEKNLRIEEAQNMMFSTTDKKRSRFKINMRGNFRKSKASNLSSKFSRFDQEFVDLIKSKGLEQENGYDEIDDLPTTTRKLYSCPQFVQKELMKRDYTITLKVVENKANRTVSSRAKAEEQDQNEGDKDLRKLQQELKKIELEFKKSDDEIAKAFVSVSGSITDLRKLFSGQEVVTWSYLEDRALTKAKDSMPYKCMIETKGEEEVERRIQFLVTHED